MKNRLILFLAYLLALPGLLHAVSPDKMDEPGMRAKPRKELKTPQDPGMVVPPPVVDTDAIRTPPKNIDPKMDDATRSIDKANRKKQRETQRKSQPEERMENRPAK